MDHCRPRRIGLMSPSVCTTNVSGPGTREDQNSQGCLGGCLDPSRALPCINRATTRMKLCQYFLCFVDEEAGSPEALALRGGVEIGILKIF